MLGLGLGLRCTFHAKLNVGSAIYIDQDRVPLVRIEIRRFEQHVVQSCVFLSRNREGSELRFRLQCGKDVVERM